MKDNFLSESELDKLIHKRKYTSNREMLRKILTAQKQNESAENQNEVKIKSLVECVKEAKLNFRNVSVTTPSRMCIIS